jgi:uncharacterized protein with HEPN domain
MKEKVGDYARLQHILNCIADLEHILNNVDEDSFYRNNEKKYAVERLLEIIGEAVNRISADTLTKSNIAIPWQDVVDFRNIVSHEYFRIDYTIVYKIATEEIPKVKEAVLQIMNAIK